MKKKLCLGQLGEVDNKEQMSIHSDYEPSIRESAQGSISSRKVGTAIFRLKKGKNEDPWFILRCHCFVCCPSVGQSVLCEWEGGGGNGFVWLGQGSCIAGLGQKGI